MTTTLAKAKLREKIRAQLADILPAHRIEYSAQLCRRLAAEKVFTGAKSILFFAPLPDEPDIWPLLEKTLREGRTAALPRFDITMQNYTATRVQDLARDIVTGKFGVREPAAHCPAVALNQLDLLLVPGVGFDWNGRRLGRGKGHYDRLLAFVPGATCGVAFDEQIVSQLPVEPHDIRLSYILTPTRCERTPA